MDDQERENIFNSLFPIGKERWIKVKYLDRDKCINTFKLGMNNEAAKKHAENVGYEVTAIGILDEHIPQISALMDVRDEIVGMLYAEFGDDYRVERVRGIFKAKMDEIKQRAIITEISG